MAWMEERGGRYIVRWRQKGEKESRSFDDRFEAEAFLQHVERRLAAGDVPILPTGMAEYGERAIRMMEGIRESSRATYLSYVRTHIKDRFSERPVMAVTYTECTEFLAAMRDEGYSDQTRKGTKHVLVTLFRAAVADGLVSAENNPTLNLPVIKGDRSKAQPLGKTVAESLALVEDLAEAIRPTWYRVPIYLGAYAGLRIGEIGALLGLTTPRGPTVMI